MDRALSGTTGTHQRIFFPRLDVERSLAKGEFLGAVTEAHILKFDRSLAFLKGAGGGQVGDGRLGLHQLEDIVGRNHAFLNEHRNPAQVFHRVVEEKNSRAEGGKFGEADPVVINIDHRQNDPEG